MTKDTENSASEEVNQAKEAVDKATAAAETAMAKARQKVAAGMKALEKDLERMHKMVAQNQARALAHYEQEIQQMDGRFRASVDRLWPPGQKASE